MTADALGAQSLAPVIIEGHYKDDGEFFAKEWGYIFNDFQTRDELQEARNPQGAVYFNYDYFS